MPTPDQPEQAADPRQAIVICTRNRTDDLRATLESVAVCLREEISHGQPASLVLVVDASEGEAVRCRHRALCENLGAQAVVRYRVYRGRASLPRQRNYAVEQLPPSVEAVHFIDDDVTVEAGYFQRLARVLAEHPDVGGVGGLVLPPDKTSPCPRAPTVRAWMRRLFLIRSKVPGRILPSGCSSSVQLPASCRAGSGRAEPPGLCPTEWLSGCSATYRRAVLERFRFDDRLEGSAPFEDWDFSYRVGAAWRLVVEPRARLVHRVSPVSRLRAAAYAREYTVHHHWFVTKNIRHPLRKPAFWWATLGRLLAAAFSAKPYGGAVLKGRLSGAKAVLQRTHPLLKAPAGKS